ncbi:MAG: DUF2064 domain-containing protein [Deltaproteobacteria bacterium]|nr:DUF2064 domain-containing protein [Deltaproteobacteria bacterium]
MKTRSQSDSQALVVMAKPPIPGEVKTRLCPPFSFAEAAEFYECLLQDTVGKLEGFASAELWIAYTSEGEDYFQSVYRQRVKMIPQRGVDLGQRMHHIFVDLFSLGYRRVVVLGSDIPCLALSTVEQTFHLLSRHEHDLALGPARDGGYYLIGLKEPEARIFQGITWSHPSVLFDTLKRAESLGLRPVSVPAAYDVDLEQNLAELWNDLSLNPVLRSKIPRTYGFLSKFYAHRESPDLG